MDKKKDLFDLIKANEHKLDQAPSPRAWDRLERRLDKHYSKRRRSRPRWLFSIAAAVVGLVVMVSIISFLFRFEDHSMAMNEKAGPEFYLEDISVTDNTDTDFYKIVEYQRKYTDRMSNPIAEGSADRRLQPKPAFVNTSDYTRTEIASNLETKRQADMPSKSIIASTVDKKEVSSDDGNEGYVGITATSINPSEEQEEPAANYDYAETEAEADLVINMIDSVETAEIAGRTASRAKAKRDYSSPPAAAREEAIVAETYGNVPVTNGIQQFQWLLGKWEGNVNNQTSIEQWKQLDERTLEGTGFLLVDGQSTFAEGMKIQQIGTEVFFMADLDGTGNLLRYRLISNQSDHKAVFENRSVSFPKQVILLKTNPNNFTTIYQNIAPVTSPNIQQQNYLNNRNMVMPNNQQVQRNLRRVEKD